MYAPFAIFAFRLDSFFDDIVVYRVNPEPPYDAMLGDTVVVRTGCDVALSMTHGRRMAAKLTFRGDTFDGVVTDMEYGGGDSGGSWQCRVTNAKLVGTRIR
jgi:hypothetical protein